MGPAKILSAIVALGVLAVAAAQSPAGTEQCPPCSKILMPVCGVDEDDEAKTFPNSCVLRWCNCMLRNADADRSFKQLNAGECEGSPPNETEIPECFPEVETTSESADDVATSRTLNVTEAAVAAGPTHAPVALLAVAAAFAALLQ